MNNTRKAKKRMTRLIQTFVYAYVCIYIYDVHWAWLKILNLFHNITVGAAMDRDLLFLCKVGIDRSNIILRTWGVAKTDCIFP